LNVDDDDDDRAMFCDALNTIDSQISCIQKDCGEKAIEFLTQSNVVPDYIFIDINMPRMNGYECLHEIRLLPQMADVPIIMFSTSFNPKDQAEFMALEIKFLNKTANINELVHSLRDLINKQTVELEVKSKR
jgi:CheY-like chemotaxis protein